MAKQFAVLHIEKGSGNATRLGSHIERKHQPLNADIKKAHLNFHHIKSNNTLNQDIDNRINEAGCKVRKNSVKHLNIVLTGSHERMEEIGKNREEMIKWMKANYTFLVKKYGQENIIRFSLHRDERTPHVHAVITPITADGRLSAREVVGNKKDLQKLQDNYSKEMSFFDLNRGVKGSKATHDSIQEFYARVNNPVQAEITIPEKKLLESNQTYIEKVTKSIEPLVFSMHNLAFENAELKHEISKMKLNEVNRKLKQSDKNINRNNDPKRGLSK